jgi:hypothetical protein
MKLRFNVNFYFDSALPGIVISGTLPQLSVHVNEDKVSTLKRMSTLLKRDYDTWTAPAPAIPGKIGEH